MAVAVFSCVGRGDGVYAGGEDGGCEARAADEALGGRVPFVGAYLNGEIGPHVRNGYVGWAFAGCDGVAGGRVLQQDPAEGQGYTSMYAAIG